MSVGRYGVMRPGYRALGDVMWPLDGIGKPSEQVVRAIEDAIIARRLHVGRELPATAGMARHYRLGRETIRRAVRALVDRETVIYSTELKIYFVRAVPVRGDVAVR